MTKSEVCRLISERLEPKPEFRKCLFSNWQTGLSDGGFWENHLSMTTNPACPLNFFESEDASARLLEAMPEQTLTREHDGRWHCDAGAYDWISAHPDRKTAIVLAACKWLNIDAEIQD